MNDREARLAWFKDVILPHEAALRRQLRREGAVTDDIDDLVAEALARAYELKDWSRVDHGRSYLFSIACNLVLDAARRNKVVSFDTFADLEVLNLADESSSVEAMVIARGELLRLQKAVDRLPPRPRQVFLMRRVDGLRIEQVADQLSLSVSTVEKHFTRAMALLTEAMAEHGPFNATQRGRTWPSARKTR